MNYQISIGSPSNRFFQITATKNNQNSGHVEFRLSSWRPGRYELGNFAKNLRKLIAKDASGNDLKIYKTSKDSWKIDDAPAGKIIVEYEYYAAQPDAGACWLNKDLLYVNPVHCILFDPAQMNEECNVKLDIPSDWKIACGLKEKNKHELVAKNYDELVDSPFFASADLKHDFYEVNNYRFNIWFQGDCNPDWKKIKNDFEGFTKVQLAMMHQFPVTEYHFLILILPFRFYHGVEHVSSTVLALGPGYKLMEEDMYTDLLGIASHELFHAWNVKTLRPADFLHYDFTKENYSSLGWVYEGFTTYYGDLFLARSNYFNVKTFFVELSSRLQRHIDNYGRFTQSVADSSYDTWLDGYVPGVPHRKTSIYDEGCLVALMLDLFIRRSTNNEKSLDTLFVQLYNDFAKHHLGYREQDLKALAESLAGYEADFFFDEIINKPVSYENKIQELLNHVGCYFQRTQSKFANENLFGFRTVYESGVVKVYSVIPDSPAAKAGLSKDDEILACINFKVENNLTELIKASGNNAEIIISSQKKIKTLNLISDGTNYFDTVSFQQMNDADESQKNAFKSWTGLEF